MESFEYDPGRFQLASGTAQAVLIEGSRLLGVRRVGACTSGRPRSEGGEPECARYLRTDEPDKRPPRPLGKPAETASPRQEPVKTRRDEDSRSRPLVYGGPPSVLCKTTPADGTPPDYVREHARARTQSRACISANGTNTHGHHTNSAVYQARTHAGVSRSYAFNECSGVKGVSRKVYPVIIRIGALHSVKPGAHSFLRLPHFLGA